MIFVKSRCSTYIKYAETVVVLYGEKGKSAYFLTRIRENCIYFGGFQNIGIFSAAKILYFEGGKSAKFQSYGHWYHLDRSVALSQVLNNVDADILVHYIEE